MSRARAIIERDRRVVFIEESNRIEGIDRPATQTEINAHERLWAIEDELSVKDVSRFVRDVAGAGLRDLPGMDVRVGPHIPPRGGIEIRRALEILVEDINQGLVQPFDAHVRYERLHPFMDGNGRSGRAIWAWHMLDNHCDPFALGFLHAWYYASLREGRWAHDF